MARATKSDAAKPQVFQFKITLRGIKPPVWRRIQMTDGSLDDLHLQIQAALGWTNSHLHQFVIGDDYYGDPDLMEDSLDDQELIDSTKTRLSKLLGRVGKSFRFRYEYDFGDSWEHEVLFEGRVAQEPGATYPRCIGGARACPPEDVGGVWGYADFLVAIGDPKHPEHKDMREWCGGQFDAENFNADETTKHMRCGVSDWRPYR